MSLLVVDDLPGLLKQGLRLEEVTRVLSPHGTAWLGQSGKRGGTLETPAALKAMMSQGGLQECEIIEEHGVWAKYVKPRPESMDVWTHQSYDASGNPASTDEMGMPNGVRWIAGPNWPRGYRKSGTKARVISEKHLIYIFRDTVLPGVPEQWTPVRSGCVQRVAVVEEKTGIANGRPWCLQEIGSSFRLIKITGGKAAALSP